MKRFLSALSAALLIAFTIGSSSAALAVPTQRTLPAGNNFYAVGSSTGSHAGQVVQVTSVANGTLRQVIAGSGPTISGAPGIGCAYPAAWDPTTNTAFYAYQDPMNTWHLFRLNPATGVSTLIRDDVTTVTTEVIGGFMVGRDGILYGVINQVEGSGMTLSTVNKTTGTFSNTHVLTVDGTPINTISYAMGYNPADGKYYIMTGITAKLYEVNVATGALTLKSLSGNPTLAGQILGMAFDSSGVMWTFADRTAPSGYAPESVVAPMAGPPWTSATINSSTVSGWSAADNLISNSTTMSLDGADWFSVAPFITYPYTPPLANTGQSIGATPWFVAGALGLGIALLAGVSIVRRRRQGEQ